MWKPRLKAIWVRAQKKSFMAQECYPALGVSANRRQGGNREYFHSKRPRIIETGRLGRVCLCCAMAMRRETRSAVAGCVENSLSTAPEPDSGLTMNMLEVAGWGCSVGMS